jgi:hypothetical protein
VSGGRPVEFGFTLANTGSVGVTVTRLFSPEAADREMIVSLGSPRMGPGAGTPKHMFEGPLQPFQPFSLAPGHQRRISMTATANHCQGRNAALSIRSTDVSFRVLGMDRVQSIDFPYTLTWSTTGRRRF